MFSNDFVTYLLFRKLLFCWSSDLSFCPGNFEDVLQNCVRTQASATASQLKYMHADFCILHPRVVIWSYVFLIFQKEGP